ncbi:hypothetical protein [Clostridium botulinum]|uniref:hypothetical protein n=1 Tax=Clostridium botulinum TaxID=1491 RepID=UPI0021BEE733|nr:hypothetical protein [Clostridium botulinum]
MKDFNRSFINYKKSVGISKLDYPSSFIYYLTSNGGVLENEIFDLNDNTITQRYWIKLA